jgi:hypothetical protein
MGWECREVEALETLPNGLFRFSTSSFTKKQFVYRALSEMSRNPDSEWALKSFACEWQILANNFSTMRFTYTKDKPIALLGIAKVFAAIIPDFCIAGMWRRTLLYELPWFRFDDEGEVFSINGENLAPSWSWLSVDGDIQFPSMHGGVKANFVSIVDFSESYNDRHRPQSTWGTIRAEGVRLPLKIQGGDEGIVSFEVVGQRFFDPGEGSIYLEASDKEVEDLMAPKNLFLLPLFATAYSLFGIVISEISGQGAYSRLGSFKILIMRRDGGESQLNLVEDIWVRDAPNCSEDIFQYEGAKCVLDHMYDAQKRACLDTVVLQ